MLRPAFASGMMGRAALLVVPLALLVAALLALLARTPSWAALEAAHVAPVVSWLVARMHAALSRVLFVTVNERGLPVVVHTLGIDVSSDGEAAAVRAEIEHAASVGRCTPFVLDVGAFDGVVGSNAYNMVTDRHWPAVLVEPAPEAAARARDAVALLGDDVRVSVVEAAVGSEDGRAPLHTFAGASSMERSLRAKGVNGAAAVAGGADDVRVISPATLVRTAGVPARPCLVSIDTEGGEADILAGLLAAGVRPHLVILEWLSFPIAQRLPFTRAHNYDLAGRVGLNVVLVDDLASSAEAVHGIKR